MLKSAIIGLALIGVPAFAAFPEDDPAEELPVIKAMIEDGHSEKALTALEPLLKDETIQADVLNLMGYAYRKLGRLEKSRTHYLRALALQPGHKGALEYMGELELQTGDVTAARALLARLKGVCPAGCLELDDLIDAFVRRGLTAE